MKVLLLGLGRANEAVARYCVERGDMVSVFEERLETISSASRALFEQGAIGIHKGGKYDCIISSPGFPMHKQIIVDYQDQGIPIIDEIEFTYRELGDPAVIAVTGTNGKSTTVALIHAILEKAGISCFLGGNIAPGKPFSQALFAKRYQYYALEVSSFQLMRVHDFKPRIAVLTNVSKDHMNWHKDVKEYHQAKRTLFLNQKADDSAVLNRDDVTVRALTRDIPARRIYFGKTALDGAHCNGSFRFKSQTLFPCSVNNLPGEHNMMNVLAAIAVSRVLRVNTPALMQGIKAFKPLPHRLEDCGVHAGIRYINNSMCTNEQAAIASLKAISGPKIVIAGGKEKGDTASEYLALLSQEAKACVILGENAPSIERFFKRRGYDNFSIAETMEDAVSTARTLATKGDTIVLNPGFASFGLFKNFEERGKAFRHAIRKDR